LILLIPVKKIKKERIRDRIKNNNLYKKTVKNKYLAIFIVLFIAIITYNYFNGGFVYDVVNQDLQETTKFIDSFGANAWLFYILAIIFEVIVVPIPSLVLNVAASSHFGPLLTSVMTIVASMIGAVIAYYIAKYFGHHYIDEMIGEAGFSFKNSIYSIFPGGGFTYVAIIGESSIDIHTWPEHRVVQITVHYCNFSKDNNPRANRFFRLMKQYFQPKEIVSYPKTKRLI